MENSYSYLYILLVHDYFHRDSEINKKLNIISGETFWHNCVLQLFK